MDFSEEIINLVWGKGKVVVGYDSLKWRQDDYGMWIGRDVYGNRDSKYGWEIDHIIPVSSNGSDSLHNLRPLHWESNLARNKV